MQGIQQILDTKHMYCLRMEILFPQHLHVQNVILDFKFLNRPYVHVFRF